MQHGYLSVIEAHNGEVLYERALKLGKGTVYPSISLAGQHIFVSSDNGTTAVLEHGREYKEIVRNKLGVFRSSPVFQGRRMYIRAYDGLYCIGE